MGFPVTRILFLKSLFPRICGENPEIQEGRFFQSVLRGVLSHGFWYFCQKIPRKRAPFSLLRFFWANKRNEGQVKYGFFGLSVPGQKIIFPPGPLRRKRRDMVKACFRRRIFFQSTLFKTVIA